MKKEKLEKQASSEIAESRERFEKEFSPFLVMDRNELGYYRATETQRAWEGCQWAERDTRERCAHLIKLVLIQVTGPDGFMVSPEELEKLLAERIRGKE